MPQSRWISTRRIIVRFLILFFVSSLGLVFFYRFAPVPFTPLMVMRSLSSIFQEETIGIHKDWVPLEDMSPSIQRAVLKAEDYRFFEHRGFDYEAIQKAIEHNRKNKLKKGASTISQQTAKNLFLWPGRSWLRKGLEAYFTVLIETFWPKERILEVYLNVIELGPGVYGVEAAAQTYFKRPAKKLNAPQAALIAAVLPNPRKFRVDKPSRYVLTRQRRILNRAAPAIPKRQVSFVEFLNLNVDSSEETFSN